MHESWHSEHVRLGGAPGGRLWLPSSNAARNKLILGNLNGPVGGRLRVCCLRLLVCCSRLYATTRAQRCERFAAVRYCIPYTRFLATAGEAERPTHMRRPQENPRTCFSSGAGLISFFNLPGHS